MGLKGFKTFTSLDNQYIISKDTGIFERINTNKQFLALSLLPTFNIRTIVNSLKRNGSDTLPSTIELYKDKNCVLTFNSSLGCGMNCKYCFDYTCGSTFTHDEIKQYVQRIIDLENDSIEKYIIDLSGLIIEEQPFVYLNQLGHLLCELAVCNHVRMSIYLNIDQYQLTRNEYRQLEKLGYKYILNIKNKVFTEKDIKYIDYLNEQKKLLSKTKLITNKKKKHINYVVEAKNIHFIKEIKKLIRYSKSIGFKLNVNNYDQYSMSTDELETIKLRYSEFVLFLLKKTISGDVKFIKSILNDEDNLGIYLKRLIHSQRVSTPCNNQFTLTKNNNIYYCNSVSHGHELNVGSLEENIDVSKLQCLTDFNIKSNERCSNCYINSLCGGECLALVINKNVNPQMRDLHCQFNQHLVELAIYLYDMIMEYNPNVIKYLKK